MYMRILTQRLRIAALLEAGEKKKDEMLNKGDQMNERDEPNS